MLGLAISDNTLYLGASVSRAIRWGKDLPELESPPQFPGCTVSGEPCYDAHVAKIVIDDSAP